MINLPLEKSQRYRYISFKQLMASVTQDLHLFDDSALIREDALLKIIHYCNDKLGVRLHESKQCLLKVENGMAELPSDFWKIEMIFATQVIDAPQSMYMVPPNVVEYTTAPETVKQPIVNIRKIACKDFCCNTMWAVKYQNTEPVRKIETIIPLSMSQRCKGQTTSYCPASRGQFSIDLEDNIIKTSFKEGELFICYLGLLEDENGDPMIPFHALLNDYYEYSLKERILENIYLNSEADVLQKLQYVTLKKKEAYLDAWQFSGTPEFRELDQFDKKRSQAFYNKWYKMFYIDDTSLPLYG
jgi:hypothetical protein